MTYFDKIKSQLAIQRDYKLDTYHSVLINTIDNIVPGSFENFWMSPIVLKRRSDMLHLLSYKWLMNNKPVIIMTFHANC